MCWVVGEVNQPKELTELVLGGGLREIPSSLNFLFEWAITLVVDKVSKKL